jgi:ribosome recycling factor
MPGFGVAQDITIEELEAAMARSIDRDGNDLRLAETVERMTPEERRESDRNIRRWVESFRLGIRSDRDTSDDV